MLQIEIFVQHAYLVAQVQLKERRDENMGSNASSAHNNIHENIKNCPTTQEMAKRLDVICVRCDGDIVVIYSWPKTFRRSGSASINVINVLSISFIK